MDIKILNKDFEYEGVVNSYDSFSYTSNFNSYGVFTLKTVFSEYNVNLLKQGNIIYIENEFSGYIDSVNYEAKKDGDMIIVNGCDFNKYLDLRLGWVNDTNTVENILRGLVFQNFIYPYNNKRIIPFIGVGQKKGYTDTIKKVTSLRSCLEICTEIAAASDYGFKFVLNPVDKKINFEVYKTTNRVAGSPNQIILGREYDNILTQDYSFSDRKCKNCVTVKNKDAGIEAFVFKGEEEASGIDRREAIIESDIDQEEKSITTLISAMEQEGKEYLAGTRTIECFDVDICEEDINLGDTITVVDKKWGLRKDTLVRKLTKTFQGGKEVITYTLGEDTPYKLTRRI